MTCCSSEYIFQSSTWGLNKPWSSSIPLNFPKISLKLWMKYLAWLHESCECIPNVFYMRTIEELIANACCNLWHWEEIMHMMTNECQADKRLKQRIRHLVISVWPVTSVTRCVTDRRTHTPFASPDLWHQNDVCESLSVMYHHIMRHMCDSVEWVT